MIKKRNKISAALKQQKNETLFEFIACVISCWLLSVGSCLLFDAQFEFEAGLVTILWQTAVSIIVIALMTRKWWIPLVYLGVMAVVGVIVMIVGHKFSFYYESAASFIGWWIDFMPKNSPWYTEESFFLLHAVVNFGVTALYFAISRITRRSWVLVLLSLGIIIAIYAFGYTKYNTLAILFFFVGLFPLTASEKMQGRRFFSRKKAFEIMGNRWLITAISTLLCIAIATTALALLDNDKKISIRTRFSSNIAADVQTVSNFYTIEQQSMRITLEDLGLQSNTKFIGGNLYDVDPAIVGITDSEDPLFVKITSFDTYKNKKWSDSFAKTYRINGPFETEQTQHLAGNIVNDDFAFAKLDSIVEQKDVRITIKGKTMLLPSVGQTIRYTEHTKTKNPVLFDERGQFVSFFGHSDGYEYTVNSLFYNTETALSLEERITIKNAIRQKDPLYTKDFVEHYTKLSTPLPEEAVTVLDMMDIDEENPYDTAYKISKHFSVKNGYRYDKKPGVMKPSDDIVETLFDKKVGHCVYYATAMISMTRHMGIPSRLAAGYRTVKGEGGVQAINTASPYCWVECYFKNLGWVSFDPSPGTAIVLVDKSDTQIPIKQEKPEPEIIEIEEVEIADDTQEPEEEKKPVEIPWLLIGIIAAAVVVILIILLFVRAVTASKYYRIENVRRRFATTKQQAEFYWQDMLRQFRNMGYKPKQGETIKELTQRSCEELIYHNAPTIMAAAKVIDALHYGDVAPTDADVELLATVYDMLDMEAKWKIKPVPYFFKRRMFLKVNFKAVKKYGIKEIK